MSLKEWALKAQEKIRETAEPGLQLVWNFLTWLAPAISESIEAIFELCWVVIFVVSLFPFWLYGLAVRKWGKQ